MDASSTNERNGLPSRARWGAWAGVLTGPAAWVIQLYGNWTLSEVVGCAPATRDHGAVLGLPVGTAAAILNAALLLATIAAGVVAHREVMRIQVEGDRSVARGSSWLASAGVMTSAVFAVVIVTSFIPIVMVKGCGP